MIPTGPRTISYVDCAIICLSTTLALASVVITDLAFDPAVMVPDHEVRSWSRWPFRLQMIRVPSERWLNDLVALVGALTIGLASVLFRPRRGESLDCSGPGSIASAIIALFTLVWAAGYLTEVIHGSAVFEVQTIGILLGTIWGRLLHVIGWALVGGWLVLAATGGWHSRRDWRDWLGRCLGWAWLGAFAWSELLWLVART